MSNVQPVFTKKLLEHIDFLIDSAIVTVNGEDIEFDIFKTVVEKDTIRKYVYLEGEVGKIEQVKLLTIKNEVLFIKDYDIEKGEDGLVLTFAFNLQVTETNLGLVGEGVK